MGQLIGGALWGYLFGRLAGHMFWAELEPDSKAIRGAIAGWGLIYTLSGFGYGNGSFAPLVGLFYLPGAAIGWWLLRRHYRKSWIDDSDADTFS